MRAVALFDPSPRQLPSCPKSAACLLPFKTARASPSRRLLRNALRLSQARAGRTSSFWTRPTRTPPSPSPVSPPSSSLSPQKTRYAASDPPTTRRLVELAARLAGPSEGPVPCSRWIAAVVTVQVFERGGDATAAVDLGKHRRRPYQFHGRGRRPSPRRRPTLLRPAPRPGASAEASARSSSARPRGSARRASRREVAHVRPCPRARAGRGALRRRACA